MSYSTEIEREILTYILDWAADHQSPSGNAPFVYPDTLAEMPTLSSMRALDADAKWRLLHSHVMILQHRGLVGSKNFDGSGEKYLTDAGFARLHWHQEQDALPKFQRFLRTSVGVLVTNLVVPIAVSVLTVIALGKFGISKP